MLIDAMTVDLRGRLDRRLHRGLIIEGFDEGWDEG